MNSEQNKTNWAQFIPLVIVFFFWGFVAASNDILIPVFKKAFDLTQGQSQLVSIAFYVAYTVGSIILLAISLLSFFISLTMNTATIEADTKSETIPAYKMPYIPNQRGSKNSRGKSKINCRSIDNGEAFNGCPVA